MANLRLTLLLLPSLALFLVSVSAEVFVSIDCGASASYSDENMLIWIGDDLYVQNGESHVVQTPNIVSHVMSTLRVFPTRKKNCYSIYADKGDRVLVRASFFYGNYDNKLSPPTFDLHFDGNHWATVVTSSDSVVYYEAVYVVKKDTISVCVAQTQPDQLPFISALEVRSLGAGMYSHVDSKNALFLRRRVAFGNNDTVRYPDDAYDRIWVPAIVVGNGLNKVTSDSLFMTVDVEDKPPRSVLQTAVTTINTSYSIVLRTNLPTIEVPIYITAYFSEVSQLDSTEKRSFELYINNEASSGPIDPPYGSALEMHISNMTASANTSFSLQATSDSTLPPLINAAEVFRVSDALTDGTNSKDVEALTLLQQSFIKLQEWSGDPCLPAPFTWDWVACSSDEIPRITALYLSDLGLYGTIPDFSGMDALENIDLHNNSFIDEVPDFFGTFPNLKELNLADNNFFGTIPSSISRNKNLKLDVSGNGGLCVSGKSCETSGTETSPTLGKSPDTSTSSSSGTKKKKKLLPIILGATLPTFFVFWIIVGVVVVLRHQRTTASIAAINAGQTGGATMPGETIPAMPMNNQDPAAGGQPIAGEVTVKVEHHMG